MPGYTAVETTEADMTAAPREQWHKVLIAFPFEVEVEGARHERVVEGIDK
jgi:hypothetical protein